MKRIYCLSIVVISLLICRGNFVNAQGVGINPTGSPASNSAGLDVDFTDKGILVPRMTQTQRDLIQSPSLGLLIFNTTSNCFNLWLGNTWKKICGDCDFNNPVPGSNGPICEGTTLYLTSTSVGNGATYQWSGPNGFVSTEQNPSIPNATAGASGSYSVTATLNGCVSTPQSTVATVNATPQTPVASNNGPLCVGNTLNLNSTTVIGASYSWTGPGNFTANTQNPTLANVQAINGGTYSVIALVAGCNSAVGTTTVTVNESPATPGTISGSSTVTSYSSGNVYSISAVSGAASYTWTVPAGASITAGGGTTAITVTFGTAGSGNVTVAASNSCGTSSSSSLSVTINPTVVSFTNIGTTSWTVPSSVTSVEVLVVGGGGGGGAIYYAGGGGGGGVVYNASYPVSGTVSVTVGGGGAGATNNGGGPTQGSQGSNSSFGSLVALGGGGGGNWNTDGLSGGSGGGAGATQTVGHTGGTATQPGSASGGFGNNGANATGNDYLGYGGGAGGGGAGSAGLDKNNYPANGRGGFGGNGLQYSISGTPTYYAGGGGGGGGNNTSGGGGDGGLGGGGNGASATGTAAQNGAPNTGGGGGGAQHTVNGGTGDGGNGGSGIVIIKY